MTAQSTRRKARWSTVDAIQQLILENDLRPGEPLPTETELCEELGVSRSSVREAIRTLSTLDIVEVRHGHGTYVGRLTLAPLVSGLVFRSQLNADGTFRTLREVLDMRLALDLGTADELVQIHQGRDDAELFTLVDRMREQSARGESFADADRAFHDGLALELDNGLARELGGAFWAVHAQAVPLLGIPPDADIQATVEAHGAMLEALQAGDVEAYRAAVVEHYRPLQRALQQASTAGS